MFIQTVAQPATTIQPAITQTNIDGGTFQAFIDYIDAKPKTIETYTRALRQFFLYMEENNITNPTRKDILLYRDHLKGKVKATTVQNYIIALKQFFKWTEQEGIYPNVSDNIKGAKVEKNDHKKDALTSDQVKKILNNIDTTTAKGKRDYALFAIMVTGGLRTCEIVRADIDDIRMLGDRQVLYIQGKGKDSKAAYIKLTARVHQAIQDYLSTRGSTEPTDPLFASTSNNNSNERMTTRSVSAIIKQRMIEAGYNSDRLTAHSLRHTAGTLNILHGGTLDETQQLLRHSNINTTMIYLHHIDRAKNRSEERIADAIF